MDKDLILEMFQRKAMTEADGAVLANFTYYRVTLQVNIFDSNITAEEEWAS